MARQQLTLFIPGLLDEVSGLELIKAAETPSLDALQICLSRANVTQTTQRGYLPELFDLFGIERDAGEDLPVASISRLADMQRQAEQDKFYLRADPVCLQADTQHAIMVAHATLQLPEDEAGQLVESLNEFLQQDGLVLEIDNERHWYLNEIPAQQIQTSPPHEVLGKNIEPHMPRGAQQVYWRRLLNELQMLLHTHPVNIQREAEGKLPVNSVWLWGGGTLPVMNKSDWQCIVGNDPLYAGLARVTRTRHTALPENADLLLQDDCQNTLCIINTVLPAVVNNDIFAWLDSLCFLNDNWMTPLVDAIKQGRLDQFTIMPANGQAYKLDKKILRKWWRRSRPIQSLVSH